MTASTDAVRITSGLIDRSATGVVWLVAWFLAGWLFTLLSRLLSPSVGLLLTACLLCSLLLLADIKHVVNNTGETEEQGNWYDNIGHFYGAWSPAKSDNQYDAGRSFLPCCCCCCLCPVLTRALQAIHGRVCICALCRYWSQFPLFMWLMLLFLHFVPAYGQGCTFPSDINGLYDYSHEMSQMTINSTHIYPLWVDTQSFLFSNLTFECNFVSGTQYILR